MQDEAFIFVVDGPLLEKQAVLLATSLARVHRGQPGLQAYAYASARSLLAMSQATRALFAATGVHLCPLPDGDKIWARDYPHGNKILACAQPRKVGRTTFLDTDMVVCRPLGGLAPLGDQTVLAVPEGVPSWGEGDRWVRAYAHIGQPLPQERVTLVRGRGISHLPYFNAGFISFPEAPLTATGARFAQHWLEVASDFDHRCPVGGKRPWLDQITLPLTLYRHGVAWRALPDVWNFSLSNRVRGARRAAKARVLHYHSLRFLEGHAILATLIEEVHALVPAGLHHQLGDLAQVG